MSLDDAGEGLGPASSLRLKNGVGGGGVALMVAPNEDRGCASLTGSHLPPSPPAPPGLGAVKMLQAWVPAGADALRGVHWEEASALSLGQMSKQPLLTTSKKKKKK